MEIAIRTDAAMAPKTRRGCARHHQIEETSVIWVKIEEALAMDHRATALGLDLLQHRLRLSRLYLLRDWL